MSKIGRPRKDVGDLTPGPTGYLRVERDGRKVLMHRLVLMEAIGPGWHPCAYCGRAVLWDAPGDDELTVDHLDGDRQNNDPGNLVPSCRGCNAGLH